jgi:hypothetical protein
MSAITYMKQSLAFIHGSYRQAADGLTPEQVHFVPEGESHSIAWVIWHGARVEDLIMQQIVKGVPQEWESGGWAARTGLPEKGFGTGQTTEEARAIRISDAEALAPAQTRIWSARSRWASAPRRWDRRSTSTSSPTSTATGARSTCCAA